MAPPRHGNVTMSCGVFLRAALVAAALGMARTEVTVGSDFDFVPRSAGDGRAGHGQLQHGGAVLQPRRPVAALRALPAGPHQHHGRAAGHHRRVFFPSRLSVEPTTQGSVTRWQNHCWAGSAL